MTPTRRGNIYALVVLINQLLVMLLYGLLAPMLPSLPYNIATSSAVTQILCFLPPLLAYLLLAKPKALYAFKRLNLTNMSLIVFMCIAIQPAMTAISALSSIFFENPVSNYMQDLYTYPLPVSLIALAAAPAFFEELTMRGVVLKNHESMSIKKAAIVNGIFFGIMHLNPQQFLYAFMMGIVFSYFVYYTKSIWASMLGHFTINAIQIMAGYASYSALESMPEEAIAAIEAPTMHELINTGIFLAVLTAIFLPVFLILFRTFISYNKRRIILDAIADTRLDAVAADDDAAPEAFEAPDAFETPAADAPPAGKVFDWVFVCIILIYVAYVALTLLAYAAG